MAKPKYEMIRPDWHKLTTDNGIFFGYTKSQVFEKADVRRRFNIIAEAERRNHLQLMERQRGVKLIYS